MKLDIRCKAGKIQVDDQEISIRIQQGNRTLWEAPCREITGFTLQPAPLTMAFQVAYQLTIHSSHHGMIRIEDVSEGHFKKLHALCPHLPARESDPDWFGDPTLTSHIESYSSLKEMQWETAEAAKYGWKFEVNAGIAGHINVGRTAAKVILTGGIGLITGASRTAGQTIVTYSR